MKRKLLSVILAMVLMVMVLSGCTSDEIGLMNLTSEMTKITSCDVDETVSIALNEEGIKGFMTAFNAATPEELANFKLPFKKLDLKLSAKSDYTTALKTSCNVMLGLDGAAMTKFGTISSDGKSIFVSRDGVINGLKLAKTFVDFTGEKSTLYTSDEYIKAMETWLSDKDFIELTSLEAAYNGIDPMKQNKATYGILDIINEFMQKAYKDYATGFVKGTNGTYEVSISPKLIVDAIEKLLIYTRNNRDAIFNELKTAVLKGYKVLEPIVAEEAKKAEYNEYKTLTDEELTKGMDEVKDEIMPSVDNINTALTFINLYKDKTQSFEKSYIKYTLGKQGTTYSETLDMLMNAFGRDLFTIKTKSTVKPLSNRDFTFNGKIVTYGDFMALNEKLNNELNPVESINLHWGSGYGLDENGLTNVFIRNNRKYGTDYSDYDDSNATFINDRLYIKMDNLLKSLNEVYIYNKGDKTVYIPRANATLEVVTINDVTYVKIRDFEKIGYEIGYEAETYGEWSSMIVTISKAK